MNLDEAHDLKIMFGKYKGKTLQYIVENNLQYIDWLASLKLDNPELNEAIRVLCDTYEKDIRKIINDREG